MNDILKNRLEELLAKKEESDNGVIVKILAVIGAVLVIAAVIYGIYSFLRPEYAIEDDDEFDDDFEDEELEMD